MEPLDDFFDDTVEIKPRPISEPEPMIVVRLPEPVAPPVQPSPPLPSLIKGIPEKNGPTQSEILLQAIIATSRKPNPNRGALINLCVRYVREHALDF
jgi:hypothetical protein